MAFENTNYGQDMALHTAAHILVGAGTSYALSEGVLKVFRQEDAKREDLPAEAPTQAGK